MLALRFFILSLPMICSVISASNTHYNILASPDIQLALRNMDMRNTYFVFLNDDLLNYIAGFIDDSEFDEEFIEQALKRSDIPSKLKENVLCKSSYCDGLLSYSVDSQKLYLLHKEFVAEDDQLPFAQRRRRKIFVESFDIKASTFKDLSVELGSSFDRYCWPLSFAISHDGKQVVQLVSQIDMSKPQYLHTRKYVIECTKSGESKPYKTFDVSDIYNPWVKEAPSLAFNKQSTKIIISMHKKTDAFYHPRQYKLFHLNHESEHEKSGAKTLIGYFKHLIAKHAK